ncbi:hypothetical protein [Streptomyces sp. NBC_01022]|uniref:hypothetical protein n=1 Tax=Streptomyces sp. NBC_01022 TaxID=2903723 RepID=UPI002DDC2E1E|nr:hypothetical protein [Streptomyces sp. NBC_01022]WRZ85826.1 hypothetical protein OG316_38915 [Streptomyces sp. NBC_01022]
MAAEAGGDDQVDRRRRSLLPRQDGHAGFGEQLGRARGERRGPRAGGEELDPQIVVEERQHIEEPCGGGDIVDDDQDPQARPTGGPPRRIAPDGHPHPPVQPLCHLRPRSTHGPRSCPADPSR